MAHRIARTRIIRQTPRREKLWTQRYNALPRTRERNIPTVHASNMDDFNAAQYMACTHQMFMVVVCASGGIAAFADGEFRGWHASVEIAVATIHPDRA